jgi:stearoyl-CoA desaturase (delta-9 desaturase)
MPESDGRGSIIWSNLLFFAIWTVATVVAVPWYVATHGVTWMEIAACAGLWLATGLSITAGYHRLFSHRSYTASAPVKLLFALFGAAAWESSIITWSAHHRFHHRHVDTDDDPYNAKAGFWHSHIGWLLVRGAKQDDLSNVPDLWKDPICAWQHRHWIAIAVVVNLTVTLGLGFATGHLLGMVVFALLLRVLLLHHFTWLINSAAHTWGSQPWSKGHTARDNWALSLLTFGEGYHNYHHTFQADYRNGPFWYNIDVTKWLIWILARAGLATGLRRVPIDVSLGRRFDQARRDLETLLRGLDDRARAALRDRIAPLERLLEESLERLEAARTSLHAADVSSPRRAFRAARRSARRAFRQWQAQTRLQLEIVLQGA